MKKICNILSLIIILVLIAAPVYASAEDSFIYDFYNEDAFDLYVGTSNDVEISWADNALHMDTLNGPADGGVGDTFFLLNCDPIDADTYYWAKIRIKNNSNATFFQFHYDTGSGITANSNTLVQITQGDTEFKEYVFNIKETNLATSEWSQTTIRPFDIDESVWTGTVMSVRLDCMFKDFPGGQIDTGSKFDLEYIGFFKSEADANAFKPDRSVTPSPEPTDVPTPKPTQTQVKTPVATKKATDAPLVNKNDSPLPIIIVAAIVIAVIAVIIILVIKKKKN